MAVFHFVDMSRKIAFLPKCFEFVPVLCKFFEKISSTGCGRITVTISPTTCENFSGSWSKFEISLFILPICQFFPELSKQFITFAKGLMQHLQ